MSEETPPGPRRRWRWAWWLLAYVSLGLGIIGIALPVVPTVPFILLSAYAASRGSQRLHDWLLSHPYMGPMISDWRENGVVGRNAKWMATTMMAATSLLLFALSPHLWLAIGVSAMMMLIAIWLWLRPESPR
ncbi:YbaN family protein [Dokdonella sp.]|uniref:YbaN family protein n=1 Tax=Dokdonella sp. TaxID=2291710 RepID=UPI003C5C6E8B